MSNLKNALLWAVSVIFVSTTSYAGEIGNVPISSNTHTFPHIAELKPIPNSYQLAKATFLPEASDEFGFSGSNLDNNHNQGDNCDGYSLSSCPTGGSCIKCPFNYKRFRVTGCKSPYLQSGDTCSCPAAKPLTCTNDKCSKYCGSTCIEKTCTVTPNQSNCTNGFQACDDGCCGTKRQCCVPCTNKITSKPAYSSYTYSSCSDGSGSHSIQTGWTCNAGYHQTNSTCTKDCIVQNCSGYSLNTCPPYGNCSSCTKTASSCATDGTYYKLDSCQTGYEISGNSCVENITCNQGEHWDSRTKQCKINQYELEICTGIVNYSDWSSEGYSFDNNIDIAVYIDEKRAGTIIGPYLESIPAYGGGDYWHPADPQWRCQTFKVSGTSRVKLEHAIKALVPVSGNYPCYHYQNISTTWINDNGTGYIQPDTSCEKAYSNRGRYIINGYYTSGDDIWDNTDVIKLKIEISYGGSSGCWIGEEDYWC